MGAGAARRLLSGLYWIEATIGGAAFVAVAGSLFLDVMARELFGNGIFGAQRFAVYCMAVSGLIGFGLAVHYGAHMRVTGVDKLAPPEWNERLNRLADVISCAACLFLGGWAVEFVWVSYQQGDRGMALDWVLWPVQAVLPWMFGSAALRYLLYAIFPPLRPLENEFA